MDNKSSPSGLAIVLCDQIIEDIHTRKKSLIGTFNQISAPTFPCRHPRMAVFVSLTEGRGTYHARLRIAHDDTGNTVAEVTGQIQFTDVLGVVELNFDLVGVGLPQPGAYSIEFYCDDALILERRFQVTQVHPPKGQPPAES